MQATIHPGSISGKIAVPPSKSYSQRILAAALLHRGTTVIHNFGNSEDELAALEVIQQLGATVVQERDMLIVTSKGVATIANEINCGESGLATRLFTPIAALHNGQIKVTGRGSLLQRPMGSVAIALEALSVKVSSNAERLPMTVFGPIHPASVHIDAAGSSQLLSGLLFALTACATEAITITVDGLKSKPYIDMTLDVLAQFGRPVKHDSYKRFYIDPAIFTHTDTITAHIESDWSSASCLLVAGAIGGAVTVTNLNKDSLQADSAILQVLEEAGAKISIEGDAISVYRTGLREFDFDATDCPDLFPALAVLATCCRGESCITGLHRLFHKESNRVESITELLWSFGVTASAAEDTLYVEGGARMNGTIIDAYNDHRIVMASAVCALRARSRVDIEGAEAVNKSYPGFFDALMACGVKCEFA